MTNLMMEHCGLDKNSRFIDVGSGIGKPNLHVAQHPGVEFSCGVEMEHSRWTLGMACLKGVLDARGIDIPFPQRVVRHVGGGPSLAEGDEGL